MAEPPSVSGSSGSPVEVVELLRRRSRYPTVLIDAQTCRRMHVLPDRKPIAQSASQAGAGPVGDAGPLGRGPLGNHRVQDVSIGVGGDPPSVDRDGSPAGRASTRVYGLLRSSVTQPFIAV